MFFDLWLWVFRFKSIMFIRISEGFMLNIYSRLSMEVFMSLHKIYFQNILSKELHL